ncbi:TetR family transcriptional regulator, partial [Vibrio anguillarum]|nr:TetR family transcriptional regulator [Vibrio anguillarum]
MVLSGVSAKNSNVTQLLYSK